MSEVTLEKRDSGRFMLKGILSFYTVPELFQRSLRMFDAVDALCIDLQEVTQSDSAGVALLAQWMQEAHRRNKSIEYRNLPPQMLAIARVSSLDHVLPIARDRS